MKKSLSYLAVLSIFLDDFVITRSPFDVYYFYIIYLLIIGIYLISARCIPINTRFLVLLLVVCGLSIIQTQMNSYPIAPVVKQLINILFSSIPFYIILKLNQFDTKKLFSIYINVAVVICVLGFLQQLTFYLFGVEYQYGYKLTSIVSEPAHLAITLAPAFFVALNKVLFKTETELLSFKVSVLIIITWFLTMSAVAMLGLVISIGILAVNKFKIFSLRLKLKNVVSVFIIVILSTVLTYFIYSKVEFIRYRIDDTWNTISANENKKLENVNLSTYTIYINYLVTKQALSNNLLLGSGIGTHSLNYDRYLDKVYNFESQDYRQFELNKEDANSLFLRLLSELGLIGLLLFLIFMYQFNIKNIQVFSNDSIFSLWLINNGCLLFFIMRLIRFGNYSALGFFLFIFLYYYSYKRFQSLTAG